VIIIGDEVEGVPSGFDLVCVRSTNIEIGFLLTLSLSRMAAATAAVLSAQTRGMFSLSMRTYFLRPFFDTSVMALTAARSAFNWSIPSLPSLVDLFPPFLLAVPKKKVSHSRKSMRAANKGLKDKQSVSRVFLACSILYSDFLTKRHCELSWLWGSQALSSFM